MNVQELLAEVTTAPVVKRAITNRSVLNEAYAYGSAFSRGMRIDLSGLTILLISGTASINDEGKTVHVARHRSHDVLSPRHRARLQGFQRGAERVLPGAETQSSAGFDRHPGDSLPPGLAG
jgi:hypothetical protein